MQMRCRFGAGSGLARRGGAEVDNPLFQRFKEYESPTWTGELLDAWCKQAMRSRIEPVKRFAGTVGAHRDLLLNCFRAKKHFSSRVIEGLNTAND